jgi:hypothetical protein
VKNSIEEIWKAGFLNEKSLAVPKINDLYNQKSKHVVDKLQRMFRVNLIVIVITAIIFPIIHYFLDALWQGVAASVLLLVTAWYSNRLIHGIQKLDQGATSLDYLKAYNRWLKDALSRGEKMLRFTYPLYFIIAMSTIYSAWNKGELTSKMYQKFPDVIFIGSVPLVALIIAGVVALLMFYFSAKMYQWDIRLIYGRVFRKLEETIAEMEMLKQAE